MTSDEIIAVIGGVLIAIVVIAVLIARNLDKKGDSRRPGNRGDNRKPRNSNGRHGRR